MSKLDSGAGTLNDGTEELKDRTSGMDSEVDTAVADAVAKFENSNFAPVSFVDSRNQVSLVQFVLRFDEIKSPEAEASTAPEEEQDTSFWGKVKIALLRREHR